ncbi:MAG: hypothetical protein ACLRNW_14735 [Neglectibacter sp.]
MITCAAWKSKRNCATEEQLSQLNLLWLDEQRQTIASLIGEIKTLRNRQQDPMDRQGQLKAQIRQLEEERLLVSVKAQGFGNRILRHFLRNTKSGQVCLGMSRSLPV